jgi:hypothetical protein
MGGVTSTDKARVEEYDRWFREIIAEGKSDGSKFRTLWGLALVFIIFGFLTAATAFIGGFVIGVHDGTGNALVIISGIALALWIVAMIYYYQFYKKHLQAPKAAPVPTTPETSNGELLPLLTSGDVATSDGF